MIGSCGCRISPDNVRVGGSFSGAQGTASNTKNAAFLITPVQIYSVFSYSGPALQASNSNAKAFEQVVTQEMDRAVMALNIKIATQIYRSGTGSVGTIAVSGTTGAANFYLPLTNASDIQLWEVGDLAVASATDGSALRSGSVTVTGVDLNTGSLVAAGTWSTGITGLTAGDYLYRTSSDATNAGTAVALQGYQAWVPPSTTALTTRTSLVSLGQPTNQS